ncbi:MAG TPA: hypothetical protein VL614_10360 [Acetobacteraceae bacterium]|jgi:hypothetical protein|nr:hypothetical protein [Acetobacteraceae bacterium]
MPAQIVVVLSDPELADATVSALTADGHDALAVHDPMTALALLGQATEIELLVASTYFGEGKPTGTSLALMTKLSRPNLKVIFTADPELVPLLEDIGRVIVDPITPACIVDAVRLTMTPQ